MRRIVHHELGQPAQVLRVEDGPSTSLGPDQVRVRVSYAPIHPGDLLGVMGSPAFGTPPTISSGGRVPGFEGAGVVSEVGARIDPSLGLKPGLRVAFFPAPGYFGSLGGETSDIRLFPPRSLTLKGVFLGHWTQQRPEQRKADIALAQRLAHEPGPLFEGAERYPPSQISNAVAHVSQAGRAGVVLFDFTRD